MDTILINPLSTVCSQILGLLVILIQVGLGSIVFPPEVLVEPMIGEEKGVGISYIAVS
jgi:hypothetical protein